MILATKQGHYFVLKQPVGIVDDQIQNYTIF